MQPPDATVEYTNHYWKRPELASKHSVELGNPQLDFSKPSHTPVDYIEARTKDTPWHRMILTWENAPPLPPDYC